MKRRVLAVSELDGGAAGCWLLAAVTAVASGVVGLFDDLSTPYLAASGVVVGVIVLGGVTLLVQGERERPYVSAEPYTGETEATRTTVVRVVGALVGAAVISAACCMMLLLFILGPTVHPLRVESLVGATSIVQSVWLAAFGFRFHLLARGVVNAQRADGAVFVTEPLRAGQRGRPYWRLTGVASDGRDDDHHRLLEEANRTRAKDDVRLAKWILAAGVVTAILLATDAARGPVGAWLTAVSAAITAAMIFWSWVSR